VAAVTRTTDSKARVSLPKAFANATVIIEQLSGTEIRIRRAVVVPEEEYRFWEETRPPLADPARDAFLNLLANPPAPNEALKRAVARQRKKHGRMAD
jgi:hypothetical protein